MSAFKTITISIVMLIALVSIFAVFTQTTSAQQGPMVKILNKIGQAYYCDLEVEIGFDEEAANDPFLPIEMKKEIPLTVSVIAVGEYAEWVIPHFQKFRVEVHLSIIDKPDWCSTIILPPLITLQVREYLVSNYANLSIKIDENAPAFSPGIIKIEVRVVGKSVMNGGTFVHDIPFTPGYLPLLKVNVPKKTSELTNPGEDANFDIEIENLGNAKTEVACRVLNQPEGWNAFIEPSTIIGSRTRRGDDRKKTIQLVVEPPIGFGYHDEREIIQVSITPSYYDDSSLEGEEYILSFIVQSKGFSTPGFEAVFVIVALIGVALIAKKRQRKKNYKNWNNGDEI